MQGEKRVTHSFAEVSESEKVRVVPNIQSVFFSYSVLDKEPVDLKVLAIHQKQQNSDIQPFTPVNN